MQIPNDITLITSNWQDNVADMFKNTRPVEYKSDVADGSLVKLRVQFVDHIDAELFFPVVNLQNKSTNEITKHLTIFREHINIPEDCIQIEPTDFSKACERDVYRVRTITNTGANEEFHVKMYSKNMNMGVLQLYDVIGIVYHEQKSIHVTQCEESFMGSSLTADKNVQFTEILQACTEVLLGDALAGQLLLSCFVSGVFSRCANVCVGKFSLHINLKNCTEDSDQNIIRGITRLYSRTKVLNLSLEKLNSKSFAPIKNYKTDVLEHSELSLPNRTLLVINETNLSVGKLTEVGLANIKHLQTLIEQQKLAFDFGFYQKDFDIKINAIIISEGKSILPHDYSVTIIPSITFPVVPEITVEKTELFAQWIQRVYTTEYSITDRQLVQDFIIETLRAHETTNADDLHQIMVLGRAFALMRGLSEPSLYLLEESRQTLKKIKDRD